MTKENFKKALQDLGFNIRFGDRLEPYNWRENKHNRGNTPDQIGVEWVSGGVSGGSCWDSGDGPDPHQSFDGDREPDFTDLDKILEYFAPNITLLQYRKLERELVKFDSRSENEYYGNYTNHASKYVEVDALHQWLETNMP